MERLSFSRMAIMKTPGVYIVEKNTSPRFIEEVPTAVPAFVGYTEKAANAGSSLLNKPWRISSMSEFHAYFGGAPSPRFSLTDKPTDGPGIRFQDKNYGLRRQDRYSFYYQMLLFYANGGSPCYVVSVGSYGDELEGAKLEAGIALLHQEREPTLLVIPEAVFLPEAADCYALQRAMVHHCAAVMRNRFAILDVYDGYKDLTDPSGDCVKAFRENIGTEGLGFAAAYYPWLDTSVLSEQEVDFTYLELNGLQAALTDELAAGAWSNEQKTQIQAVVDKLGSEPDPAQTAISHRTLLSTSRLYRLFLDEARSVLNRLPVSAAMAGIYTMVDNSRGVWKAPANTGVAMAVSPTVLIGNREQEELNVPIDGKAVNAIRTFVGEGIKVWGARTLDGNSLDWRYLNVRRTTIMLEESCRNAIRAYLFEPNDASTWINIKRMLSDFLTTVWKRGGLSGACPEDAFSVQVGLSETMTPEDILEGVLRVTVLVAISRPAEFIEIAFRQQMQKS